MMVLRRQTRSLAKSKEFSGKQAGGHGMNNNKTEPDKNHVMIESRGQKLVTCPYCWTDQRTGRDFCYCCGAVFLYRDEQIKKNINGPAPEAR